MAKKSNLHPNNDINKCEDMFRFITENTSDVIRYQDDTGKFTYISPNVFELTGYTAEEYSKFGSLENVVEEDHKVLLDAVERFNKGEENISVEYRLFHKNKHIIWVESRMKAISNEDGNAISLLTSTNDITDKKEAKIKLKESEEKFKALFDASSSAIYHTDKNGKCLMVNKRWQEMSGMTNEEALGDNWINGIYEEDRASVFKAWNENAKSGSTWKLEYRFCNKKGDLRWVTGEAKPLFDENNKITGYLGTNSDITCQKLIQTKLKAKQNHLENAQELGKIGSWDLDVINNVLVWTDENYKIFGLPIGTPLSYEMFLSRIHPDDREYVNEKWTAAMKGEEDYDINHRLLMDNGDVKWIREKANLQYDKKGNCIRGIGFSQDITDAKKAEQTIKESEGKFRELYEQSPLAIQYYDKNGDLLNVNKKTLELYGIKSIKDIAAYNFFKSNKLSEGNVKDLINGKSVLINYKLEFSEIKEKKYFKTEKTGVLYFELLIAPILAQGNIIAYLVHMIDITKQKVYHNELLKSEERYKALSENAKHVIIVHDLKGKITYANDYTSQLLGNAHKQIIGSDIKQLLSKENNDDHIQRLNKIINGESTVQQFDLDMVLPNGVFIYFEVIASPITANGKLNSLLITAYDITERKQSEIKIRENEEKLRLAIDNSPLGISTNDMKGNYITTNAAYEEIVGYSKEELRELNFRDLTHPDYLEDNDDKFNAMAKQETPGFNIEKKYIKKDGSLVDVRIHAGSINDEKGVPLFGMAFIEDISDTKYLMKRNKMLYEGIESSPVSVVITNIDGDIEYVNPFFSEITGFSSKESIGQNPRMLKGDLQPHGFYKKMWDTLLKGERWFGEFYNKKKNGEMYWENAIISPILNSKGNITHFVAIKEDITELKNTLDELQMAKDKAEEANALKSEFLHNMSHEIRTPMNGIIGFANLLSNAGELNEKQKNFTSIIQNSSNQLLQIINDILEISTLETKQIAVQNSEIDVEQFIFELYSIYDLKSKERRLPLYVKKDKSTDNCILLSDEAKLNKILSNLLDNAFKFTNNGYVELGYTINDSTIVFFVKDTGIGISADKQTKIFERFSQESSTTAQTYGGLGLGLSIAKESTELLGGRLIVESEKDKGASFYVEIPYNKPKKPKTEKLSYKGMKENDNVSINVLVAEDEEVNFLYIEAILGGMEDYNINLLQAINGQEAVDICLSNDSIDLVLMDIKMPILNGYQAAKLISEVKPDLPIIAQTAYSTIVERNQAIKHGCNAFISKPTKKEELFAIINRFFEKK